MKTSAAHININFCHSPCVAFKPKYHTRCILTIWSRIQQMHLYKQGHKHDPYKTGRLEAFAWSLEGTDEPSVGHSSVLIAWASTGEF